MPSVISNLFAQIGSLGLALVFVLCIRSTWLDRAFKGLHRVYRTHHWVALVSLLFIFAHAFIETSTFGFTLDTLNLYIDEFDLLAGWISLLMYSVVVFFSKKRKWPHRIWTRVHLLSLPAWLLGSYHIIRLLTPGLSQIVGYTTLTLGTLAIIRSQILPRTRFWGVPYKIKNIQNLNYQVCELTLQALKAKKAICAQRPAQYFYLRFNSEEQSRAWHPFTCLSKPGDNELVFAIKALGKDTRVVRGMILNQKVDVIGPFGRLPLKQRKKEAWFVGGIGATPLLAASRRVNFGTLPVRILHAVDKLEDQIYLQQWTNLKKQHSTVSYQLWVTHDRGYVNIEAVNQMLKDFEMVQFYIAGPDPFIAHIRNLLKLCGVNKDDIYTEEFVRL